MISEKLHEEALLALKETKFDLGIKIYKKILDLNPNDFEANCNLGLCFLQQGNYKKSLELYLKSFNIQPNSFLVLNSLGVIFSKLNEAKKSQFYYLKAYNQQNNNLTLLLNIANFYYDIGKYKLSKKYFIKFYFYEKKHLAFYRGIYKVNRELGIYQETISFLKKGIKIYMKDNLYLFFLYLNCFPKIHTSKYSKFRLVKRFNLVLDRIIEFKNSVNISNQQIINIFTSSTNFYLGYCHEVKKNILKKYFSIIELFSKKIYINYNIKEKSNYDKSIIQIGFVSETFYNHTVTRLFWNFFTKLKSKFKVTLYNVGQDSDKMTDKLKQSCQEYIHNTNIDYLINHIQKKKISILIYPEIGMGLKIPIMSSMRLANIQCMLWGHPITSGSSNIDYFISSELMETEDSQRFYNEKLIKLPGIGIDLNKEIFKSHDYFSESQTENRVLVMQSLFKILPEDYDIYFNLLMKSKNLKIFFIKDLSEDINKLFFLNLKKRFNYYTYNSLLRFEDCFGFVKRMDRDKFIKNLKNYCCVLDTFNWSGGNTHIEALLAGLPVVTFPGKEMRSRHTYAFLKKIELQELIANNHKDFEEIVLKLISDKKFYCKIIKKIKSNKKKLYQNDCVTYFENFLENALNH